MRELVRVERNDVVYGCNFCIYSKTGEMLNDHSVLELFIYTRPNSVSTFGFCKEHWQEFKRQFAALVAEEQK